MTPSKPETSSAAAYFCAGCNMRFFRERLAACPRCGILVDGDVPDPNQPTLLFKTGFPGRVDPLPGEDDSLHQLVGEILHVYYCRSLLGRGGMGWVYLAEHNDLRRDCALKILSPKLVKRDPEYLQHFWNEGRAAAALVQPNIITTHAIGESRGYHFLEMEFVRGRSLQHLIDRGPLPPLKALTIICGIAEGLAAAHRAGILHRDLKPDNVLLTHRGVPKLADFGLAKRLVGEGVDPARRERLAGTPQFMGPELFQGHPASPASDVYALGVCLFLMLTGRLPYPRPRLNQIVTASVQEPFPAIRDYCPEATLDIAECIGRLTAKSPQNRPPDAIEAGQYLRALLGQLRDTESLLRDAFDDDPDVEWESEERRHRLQVRLSDGRSQTVFIETSGHPTQERLMMIFTICCPVQPSYYEQALRLNAEVSHGGIAIRDLDGVSYFVMADTYPRATVDAEEIRKSVLEIASRADAIEQRLTGDDRY